MTRVLALLAAIGMVAAAFVIRPHTADLTGPDRPAARGQGPVTVLCDAELAAACQALVAAGHDVTTEAAGDSYKRLVAADATLPDVWVVPAPWPAMVDEARTRTGAPGSFATVDTTLASSPLALVAWADRGQVLADHCGTDTLDWGCVSGAAGSRWAELGGQDAWGNLKPGLPHPVTSSTGLAVLAQATTDQLGTTGFGSRSLADGEYLDWLARLGRAVPDLAPTAGSPLAAMLSFGPATFDVAGTTEAAATAAARDAAQRGGQVVIHVPDDAPTLDVVAATPAGSDLPSAVADTVVDALSSDGWRTASAASGDGTGTTGLAASPGESLPAPGAMTALRTAFTDTVRR